MSGVLGRRLSASRPAALAQGLRPLPLNLAAAGHFGPRLAAEGNVRNPPGQLPIIDRRFHYEPPCSSIASFVSRLMRVFRSRSYFRLASMVFSHECTVNSLQVGRGRANSSRKPSRSSGEIKRDR